MLMETKSGRDGLKPGRDPLFVTSGVYRSLDIVLPHRIVSTLQHKTKHSYLKDFPVRYPTILQMQALRRLENLFHLKIK
jgi:hypothetical protein